MPVLRHDLMLPRSCGHLIAWDDVSREEFTSADVTTAVSAGVSAAEPTCPGGRPRTLKPSPSQSTTAPARSSTGRTPPKSSKNSYAHSNSPVLQRPVEL